jgi:elongation of very long chain fatty acids protein 6
MAAVQTLAGIPLIPRAEFTERYYTVRGTEFSQIFQALPALKPFYMDWEKNYNAEKVYWWIIDNSWLPWISIVLYVAFIFGYPQLADARGWGKKESKFLLASWNFLLAMFSWAGAFRVVPHFFYLLATEGFDTVICGEPEPLYGDGAVGFWVQAFVLSKVAELIDTVFLSLKKKPPIFLHW